MTPRQPVEHDFNGRCQIQPRRHWPGENEKRQQFLSPFLVMGKGFLFAEAARLPPGPVKMDL